MKYIAVLALLAPSALWAQTINASSCSESAIAAALTSVNQATATINVPAGTCDWTNGQALAWTVPSNNTSLTIQGTTTCTGSGDPASNNLACTDGTIIVNNDTSDTNYFWQITTNATASSFFRLTGITFEAGSNTFANDASIIVQGGSQNVRLDHDHFNMNTATAGWSGNTIEVGGCVYGVADHNLFDEGGSEVGAVNVIIFYNGSGCDTGGNGDQVFNDSTGFGGSQFFYVEQNRFNVQNGSGGTGMENDCIYGGKFVWRFNSSVNGHLQTHPTGSGSSTARYRGCRAQEIYGNNFTNPTFSLPNNNPIATMYFMSSGTALIWGNTTALGYDDFITLNNCRYGNSTGCGYAIDVPPNGWGYCGTTYGPSGWDGNTNSSGYPCIDQPGRGKSDLIQGAWPDACDETTGCTTYDGTWPNQNLEPVYVWLDNFTPVGNGNGGTTTVSLGGSANGIFTQNTDYYVSSDPNSGTDCSGFTGSTGVGCGPLASRPSTCTAGPGGTYGASPTGSYGAAYWATDQGSWNQSGDGFGQGELFVCTATNTWTASYTPYTYPYPLDVLSLPALSRKGMFARVLM